MTKSFREKNLYGWLRLYWKIFLGVGKFSLTNDEFEDSITKLLTALGFKVVQKEHKFIGEYPDGIATLDKEYKWSMNATIWLIINQVKMIEELSKSINRTS